jgi:hypothetical protein
MSAAPTLPPVLGPVSATLEKELRRRVQRHGVVAWLDLDGHYSDVVDALAAQRAAGHLPYEVKAWRGSHLELMLALEDLAAGKDPPRLVVHLPGFNEESIRETPLLELYLAGVRFRKKLDTLITEAATGEVVPDEIDAFTGQADLTLEGADLWLRTAMDAREGGLAAQLRAISPGALVDDLLDGGHVAGSLAASTDLELVWSHLEVVLALPASWRGQDVLGRSAMERGVQPKDVAHVMASWSLAVEYVEDLKHPPTAPRLVGIDQKPAGTRAACRDLAAHLRERHPDFYRRAADETETLLQAEVDGAKAEDLGRIDTFRFEERAVLRAAIAALRAREWGLAAEYADLRVHGSSFWVRHDLSRRSAWRLVASAASLGQAIAEAGPALNAKRVPGFAHGEALERYAEAGALIDRLHRQLEQTRLTLLSPELPEFEALRECLDAMRAQWSTWADAWAEGFSSVCDKEGFLPPSNLQQRTLFDEVVRPLAAEGTTAFFVIDAFRYEMGVELWQAISSTPATNAQLSGRFAELPTNTEVGMNVLAPVVDHGRLKPALKHGRIDGFATGEFRVRDPETRRRAMQTAVGGKTCPWLPLAEVVARDAKRLKKTIAQASLVVVHSEEIDKAGEKGVGTAVFDTVMQQIRVAWRLLHEAGVRRFVFTADHGFLLLDPRTTIVQAHGRKIDPKRRHVLSEHATDHADEARVALEDLGYEGAKGWDAMFPRTTAPFDTGARTRTFVHGGNSLQERVIPVLTVVHRTGTGGTSARYRIDAEADEGMGGMHCLKATVEPAAGQSALGFGSAEAVELAVEVPELPDVSVELCHIRGAELTGGGVRATVGSEFELFFRLLGRTDARARVVLRHPGAGVEVEPGGPRARYAVAVTAASTPPEAASSATPPTASTAVAGESWLNAFEDEGVRAVFDHIEAHGSVREDEAAKMLGGGRKLRRFSAKFEEYASVAPFALRIDVVAGVKRYVKEGA